MLDLLRSPNFFWSIDFTHLTPCVSFIPPFSNLLFFCHTVSGICGDFWSFVFSTYPRKSAFIFTPFPTQIRCSLNILKLCCLLVFLLYLFWKVLMLYKTNWINLRSVQFYNFWKSNKLKDRHYYRFRVSVINLSLNKVKQHF